MDSIRDVLASKDLDQPSEMKSIQEFLDKEFGFAFRIKDYPNHTTLSVGNGKIAYRLRTMLPKLEAYAAPTKRIHIRIDNRLEAK